MGNHGADLMPGVMQICGPCSLRGVIVFAAYRCTEHHEDLCDDCTVAHLVEHDDQTEDAA